MKRSLVIWALSLALGAPVMADCLTETSFFGTGEIRTKGGGTYSYGITVGGVGQMVGYLTGRPDGLPEVNFDLEAGYHIEFANAGLARLLAPEASAAEPSNSLLTVAFSPQDKLPEASPGQSWSGEFSVTIFAQGPDDYNRREIGEATMSGSYAFLAEISADFDGCSYRIIPVELDLSYQGQTALKRRILYFRDLGVSAITKWGPDADGPGRTTGITALGMAE